MGWLVLAGAGLAGLARAGSWGDIKLNPADS